jgi:hypothetical protein
VTPRETALKSIAVGDIFHATTPNNANLNCLALEITESEIVSRTICTWWDIVFDRGTGIADKDFHGEIVRCTIDSVAPLSAHIRETLLELDRRDRDPDADHRLTEAERRTLAFVARYFPANPIAPPAQAWEMMASSRTFAAEGDPEDYDSLTGERKVQLILSNFLIPRNRQQEP